MTESLSLTHYCHQFQVRVGLLVYKLEPDSQRPYKVELSNWGIRYYGIHGTSNVRFPSPIFLKNRESINFGYFHDRLREGNQFMIHEPIHEAINICL